MPREGRLCRSGYRSRLPRRPRGGTVRQLPRRGERHGHGLHAHDPSEPPPFRLEQCPCTRTDRGAGRDGLSGNGRFLGRPAHCHVDAVGPRHAGFRQGQPRDRPDSHRRRAAGRRREGDPARLRAERLGLDRADPRLRPAHRPVPRSRPAPVELRPRSPGSQRLWSWRTGAPETLRRHHGAGPGRGRPAQRRAAAPRRR